MCVGRGWWPAQVRGGSGQLEDETLRQFLNLPSETREDRTKRLFRHYTVGSYDSLSAHRYRRGGWAGGRWSQMGGEAPVGSSQRGGVVPNPRVCCLPRQCRDDSQSRRCPRTLSGARVGSA